MENIKIAGKEYPADTDLLDLSGAGLTNEDVELVAKLTELTHLDLSNNNITDISPLRSLKKMQDLDVSDNSLRDIDVAFDLPDLILLYANNNPVLKISPVQKHTRLNNLCIRGCSISDLSFVSYFPNLHDLAISIKNISDFTPLKKPSFLSGISLTGGNISEYTDISFLSELENIDFVDFRNMRLQSLEPLFSLPGLYTVFFIDCVVNPEEVNKLWQTRWPECDFRSFVSKDYAGKNDEIFGAKHIKLSGKTLSEDDMKDIFDAKGLEVLELIECRRFYGLERLTGLKYLGLRDCKISHIKFLASLKKLEYLDLSHNEISDISPLLELNDLRLLSLDHNPIKNPELLCKLSLRGLRLSKEPGTRINFISEMQTLEVLQIKGFKACDIPAVSELKNLKRLYIKDNSVDKSGIEKLKQALGPECKIYRLRKE